VIRDTTQFLDWYEGVHRRTVRDLSLLPSAAESWRPDSTEEGEASWGVPQIVEHLAESRGYFTGAFLGEGWVWDTLPERLSTRETWVPALDASLQEMRERLGAAARARLSEKIELIDSPGREISGWRILMMMAEHEIAHRAQIGAYAGLNGWPVAQLFDRTNEWVRAQRDKELERHRKAD
jgi:uncharacterized damage-inducible protein DinB